jgi:hypothetical protein
MISGRQTVRNGPKDALSFGRFDHPGRGSKVNKAILGVALALCVTAALAQGKPDRPNPIIVQVVNGTAQVPEDPAYSDETDGGLCWKLTEPGYEFPGNGIVLNSPDWKNCSLAPNCDKSGHNTGFHCAKVKHVPGGTYKYTVNLIDNNSKPLPPLDPVVQNH